MADDVNTTRGGDGATDGGSTGNELEHGAFDADDRYFFGEPEELDNRNLTGYKAAGVTEPSARPTHFEQIPFGSSAPGRFNDIGSDQFGIPLQGVDDSA